MKSYVCEETGEIGSSYCKPSKQLVRKDSNAVVAVPCNLYLNGCICGMAGRRWRVLTPAEAAIKAKLGERECAETIQWLLTGQRGPQPPHTTYADIQRVLLKETG